MNEPETRFEFGANWSRFLHEIDEERVAAAVASLQTMLKADRLDGMSFLDAGSGSGLFSLAAHRLGARVCSFDVDPQSVQCTQELRRRFGQPSPEWTVLEGSVLHAEFLQSLEYFDVVYSWGVLHHTGQMWKAADLVAQRVRPGGRLWIAIYNDQGPVSGLWTAVKETYQRLPTPLRALLVLSVGASLFVHRVSRAIGIALGRLLLLRNPLTPLTAMAKRARTPDPRGMHRWYDLVDWVGGWPFETAKPDEVVRFLRDRGFVLEELRTCGGGLGCNEFLFRRPE